MLVNCEGNVGMIQSATDRVGLSTIKKFMQKEESPLIVEFSTIGKAYRWARVQNHVAPLRCFKIFAPSLFLRREIIQSYNLKFMQNIPL